MAMFRVHPGLIIALSPPRQSGIKGLWIDEIQGMQKGWVAFCSKQQENVVELKEPTASTIFHRIYGVHIKFECIKYEFKYNLV